MTGPSPAPEADRGPVAGPEDRLEVAVNDLQRHLAVDPAALADLTRRVLHAEGVEAASLSLVLVDDAAIHALNRRHLQHDWPTDIITFALSGPDDEELAGELIVSTEMAMKTARSTGGDPRDELALYLVHGLLHLCGYDDQSAEATDAMRRREGEVLAGLGLCNPFPLAARPPAGPEVAE